MSKRKRNVAYIKPDEPKFLRELKEQAGYKEGPTVDTKKEILEIASDEDERELDEEEPVVVVLKNGDLTAEEALAFTQEKEKEEENAPADLSKRIIFKKTKNTESVTEDSPASKKTKKIKNKKAILSFNENEDD